MWIIYTRSNTDTIGGRLLTSGRQSVGVSEMTEQNKTLPKDTNTETSFLHIQWNSSPSGKNPTAGPGIKPGSLDQKATTLSLSQARFLIY